MIAHTKLTAQRQITIPKRVCERLHLRGGDRLEIMVTPDHRLTLKPQKLIDLDDPAYQLGQEILAAEHQIRRGETVPWSEVKRRHGL